MRALVRKPNVGYIDNWFWVPKNHIDCDGVRNALSMRFTDSYAESKIRYVYLYKETETHLLVPRCLWSAGQMPFRVVDCRPREYHVTGITSRVKLDHRRVNGQLVPTGENVQHKAMEALLRADSGILQLGCGKGKTVIALDLIARLQGPGLIVVDNTNLLEQWKDDIKEFLDVPGGVGLIQGKEFDWQKGVVLATYQTLGSLAQAGLPDEVRRWFRVVIFDEGHHLSAVTFAPCAESFYGMRLALTATKDRDDGLHVIYDNHVGPVVYKDITHAIKPRIIFKWTGIGLDPTSPVYDKNGEVHISKVSSFFGRHQRRLAMILDDTDRAVQAGRKVLVLCNSVDEAVNLCSAWTQRNWHNPKGTLYTDIPIPTPAEVGHRLQPAPMDADQRKGVENLRASLIMGMAAGGETEKGKMKVAEFDLRLEQDDSHRAIASEMARRERKYRDWLTSNLTNAGLMIHAISPEDRMEYIRTKRVIFGITKYGKEGLDDEWLDTVLVSTPFSSRNVLQQVLGRPTRQKPGKKYPLVLFYEDNINTLIGMCQKLRRHLNGWLLEEGGPFDFEMHDHPSAAGRGYRPIFDNAA